MSNLAVPPWDYVPTGPYTVWGVYLGTEQGLDKPRIYINLADACAWFANAFVPPRMNESAVVYDHFERVVVGYAVSDHGIEWWGCAEGFDALEPFFTDKLEFALCLPEEAGK